MKIGIATSFYRFDPGYSLCAVVKDQLLSLVKHGHSPVFFVLPSFKDDALVPAGVEIRKIVPQLILEPYKGLGFPDHWKEDVKKAKEMFEKNMADIDHLIVHDWFFIDTFLPYNLALRDALPKLKCTIFAWTHSRPSTRPILENNPHASRYNLNSDRIKLVYLNHVDTLPLAEMYGAWQKDVRVVHNSRDPRSFWNLDPLVEKIVNQYDLLDKDIISIYPLSTTRMTDGKGIDKAIKLHSKLKELGYKTCLIIPNAHANAEREKRTLAQVQLWASERGIGNTELIFTSLLDAPNNESGVNPKVISDLFRLSNVFIFPTISENCSLVLLEAMLSGNLLILNQNVTSLREFGQENAIYLDFTYREKQEENERYYLDLAKIVASQFEISKPLQAKRRAFQQHNFDHVFKKLIEPLFYEDGNIRP